MTTSETLTLGRKLHNALRHAIEDTETYANGRVNRQDFEHYACGMYLAGTMAFMEGKYGERCWERSTVHSGLDAYLTTPDDDRKPNLLAAAVSERGLAALICIRNAVIHNDGDLSQNKDSASLFKVTGAALPGVSLAGSYVRLISNQSMDFMEYVRLSFVAVSMMQGDL